MRDNTSFSAMHALVNGTVGANGILGRWEGLVEVRFPHIAFSAVDGSKRGVRVERKAVRSEAYDMVLVESAPVQLGSETAQSSRHISARAAPHSYFAKRWTGQGKERCTKGQEHERGNRAVVRE